MKYIAITYMILGIGSQLLEPMLFGKDRGKYTFAGWLSKLIINAPVYYLLFQFV